LPRARKALAALSPANDATTEPTLNERRCREAFVIIHSMKRLQSPDRRFLAVDLEHVHLVRGARRILRDLSWRIRPGQRWVLLGANGAGKTQLLKLIAGDVWPQPRADTRRCYRWRGAASDEPYAVRDEIAYLGAERQDRYEHYDWNFRASTIVGTGLQRSDTPQGPFSATQRSRIAYWLGRLGIARLGGRCFLDLSQGERRLVLLARALAWRPALLLLDEPLNGLDAAHRALVLAALATLSRSALPWIYATQHAAEAPQDATHWARLQDGKLQLLRRGARQLEPVARAPAHEPARLRTRAGPAARAGTAACEIELRNASVWRDSRAVLRGLSLQIRSGERWLVHGPNGSGKSTLLATLYGDLGVDSRGQVWRRGHAPGAPLANFQRRVGYVGPELQAKLPRQATAQDCVAAALRGSLELVGKASSRERSVATRALRRVGALAYARRTLGELSYGQARRVLFARALARHPDIVLLDEPYTGLDASTRTRLRALVDAEARRGCTVVIATHERSDCTPPPTHELELGAGVARYCGALRAVARRGRRPLR
jgi:molybdate transport system ATP-binding protein